MSFMLLNILVVTVYKRWSFRIYSFYSLNL